MKGSSPRTFSEKLTAKKSTLSGARSPSISENAISGQKSPLRSYENALFAAGGTTRQKVRLRLFYALAAVIALTILAFSRNFLSETGNFTLSFRLHGRRAFRIQVVDLDDSDTVSSNTKKHTTYGNVGEMTGKLRGDLELTNSVLDAPSNSSEFFFTESVQPGANDRDKAASGVSVSEGKREEGRGEREREQENSREEQLVSEGEKAGEEETNDASGGVETNNASDSEGGKSERKGEGAGKEGSGTDEETEAEKISPSSPHSPSHATPYIVFYRILGNDMPPLQSVGQIQNNLEYTLQHEPEYEGFEKRYMLNRIVGQAERHKIIRLLGSFNYTFASQRVFESHFNLSALARNGFNFSAMEEWNFVLKDIKNPEDMKKLGAKIREFTNLNKGRNEAIAHGLKSGARWIMCFDGNQFLTKFTFETILRLAREADKTEELKYIEIPMVRLEKRCQDPSWLHADSSIDDVIQYTGLRMEEGQLMFRNDSTERFNENIAYSLAPKQELLDRVCAFNSTQCLCHDTDWCWNIKGRAAMTKRISECGVTTRLWNFPERRADRIMTGHQRRDIRIESAKRFVRMVEIELRREKKRQRDRLTAKRLRAKGLSTKSL